MFLLMSLPCFYIQSNLPYGEISQQINGKKRKKEKKI
uniref:Uncharacterized protein n=1 Tax=Rhizophora mucronata TaxID=61149 RepID=A0A2P2IIP4_RHIMU